MGRVVNGVVVWDSSEVLAALRGDVARLNWAMGWDMTPQGWAYWNDREEGRAGLTDNDRAFLRGLLTDEDRATWDAENADAERAAERAADVAEAERAVIAAALAWYDDADPDRAALSRAVANLAALRTAK